MFHKLILKSPHKTILWRLSFKILSNSVDWSTIGFSFTFNDISLKYSHCVLNTLIILLLHVYVKKEVRQKRREKSRRS